MTEAEIIEAINKKRNELEASRSGNAGAATLQALEEEIKTLELSLSSAESKPRDQQVFLDECAG